ncbi:hypothetical protein ACVWZ8_004002 [Arthrobacter sp. UYCu723]
MSTLPLGRVDMLFGRAPGHDFRHTPDAGRSALNGRSSDPGLRRSAGVRGDRAGCHNFFDSAVAGNAQRRRNLELYLQEMLDWRPKVLLLGEAPGFRGMGITVIPFTNRSILEGPANEFGLFGPGKGYVLPPGSEDIERRNRRPP